jgi:hypothetical protein
MTQMSTSDPLSQEKAILVPSGEKAGSQHQLPRLVSCVSPDPSAFITQISALPERSLAKAMRAPEGDQDA